MKVRKIFLFILIIVVLGVGGYSGRQQYARFQRAKQQQLINEARKAAWRNLQQRIKSEISQFKGESGIVVKDLEAGGKFHMQRLNCFLRQAWPRFLLWRQAFWRLIKGALSLIVT